MKNIFGYAVVISHRIGSPYVGRFLHASNLNEVKVMAQLVGVNEAMFVLNMDEEDPETCLRIAEWNGYMVYETVKNPYKGCKHNYCGYSDWRIEKRERKVLSLDEFEKINANA